MEGNRGLELEFLMSFPMGFRILLIDSDRFMLKILQQTLLLFNYDVTTSNNIIQAIHILQERKENFDLILADVPNSDEFELGNYLMRKFHIPLIVMSECCEDSFMSHVMNNGACHFLQKPISPFHLENIWRHVITVRTNLMNNIRTGEETRGKNIENLQLEDIINYSTFLGREHQENSAKRKRCFDGQENHSKDKKKKLGTQKKPRLIWDEQLKEKFQSAIDEIGIENAVPTRILEVMNVPGLSRLNISSYLQKYRMGRRKNGLIKEVNPTEVDPTSNVVTRSSYEILSQSIQAIHSQENDIVPSSSVPIISGTSMPFQTTTDFSNNLSQMKFNVADQCTNFEENELDDIFNSILFEYNLQDCEKADMGYEEISVDDYLLPGYFC